MYDPARGYPSVVPYLRYVEPVTALAWLSEVLAAREAVRMILPDGRIGHAELVVDDHVIAIGLAISDETTPPAPTRQTLRAMTLVFVTDVDAAAARAVDLDGTLIDGPADMPWGLRQAVVADPEGHLWELTAHLSDVPLNAWGAEPTGPPLPG